MKNVPLLSLHFGLKQVLAMLLDVTLITQLDMEQSWVTIISRFFFIIQSSLLTLVPAYT